MLKGGRDRTLQPLFLVLKRKSKTKKVKTFTGPMRSYTVKDKHIAYRNPSVHTYTDTDHVTLNKY